MAIRITRSAKLLNYVQNDNGLTKFYSELDSGLAAGDYVYISGGNYDNCSSSYDGSFDPYTNTAYVVKSVNANDNSFTLDITYTGTQVVSGTDDVFCGRSVMVTGQMAYPKIGDGVLGRLSSNDSALGVKTIPNSLQNSNPTYMYQGIWNGGSIMHAQWGKWAFSGPAPSIQTNKMVLATVPIKVSVRANNDGLGYSMFRSGTFGSGSLAASHAKWFNGTLNGGTFSNGIWSNGEMSSVYAKAVFSNGKWYAGTAKDVLWQDGTWYGGTWYGAYNIAVNTMSISGANLRVYVDSRYLPMFSNGDSILLTGVTGTAQTPSGDSLFNNYTATVNNTPSSAGYISFTKPSSTLPSPASYAAARISFAAFKKGSWQSGTANVGVFGNSTSTGDTDTYFSGTANSIVWLNGLFTGTISRTNQNGGSKVYNGLILNSSLDGSTMYNGHFKNGIMVNSSFDGGFFIDSTAVNCIIGNNILYKAVWVGGTFMGGYASENTYWKSVNYMGGTWAYPLQYQAQVFPGNTYTNLGTATTLQLPTVGQQAFNITTEKLATLKAPAVATALRSDPVFIPAAANKPMSIIEFSGITYFRGYKYMDLVDVTNINAANMSPGWASPGPAPTIDSYWTMYNPTSGIGVTNYEFFGRSTDGMPTTWQLSIGLTQGITTTYYVGPGTDTLPMPGAYTLTLEIDFDELLNVVTQLPAGALEIDSVVITKDTGGGPTSYISQSGAYVYPGSTGYSYAWVGTTDLTVPNLTTNLGSIPVTLNPGDILDITVNYKTRNTYQGPITAGSVNASFTA